MITSMLDRLRQRWLLAIIVAVSALLRLVHLGRIPSGFTADEAGAGYNGLSLLLTGRDRLGNVLPLFVNNFGDLIEATYSYLTVPAVALFGLTEFSSRLPAAMAGILTVPVLFALGARLFDSRVGYVAAALLAISPWHVQICRHAGSTPLLVLGFSLALLLFVVSLRDHRWLPACALGFAACLYTYPAARGFVPLFLLGAALLHGRQFLVEHRRPTAVAALLFVLACLPAMPHWLSAQGLARARFVVDGPLNWLPQYLSYFSPDFLFLSGDTNIRHSLPDWGQLYLFEALTLPAGLVGLWLRWRRDTALVALWLVLYPIPAALTDAGHAIRASLGAPVLALVSALGIVVLLERAPCRIRRFACIAVAAVVLASAGAYSHSYFTRYGDDSAVDWQFGMRDTYRFVAEQNHRTVLVSDRLPLPHMFILFYTEFPPERYQATHLTGLTQGEWDYTDFSFGRYRIDATADILATPCDDALVVVFADESVPFRQSPVYDLRRIIKVPTGERLIEIFSCRQQSGPSTP